MKLLPLSLFTVLILSAFIMTNATADQHPNAFITIQSKHSVEHTADRFATLVEDKGLTLFTRIDHAANAKGVDLELRPTQVILFGNPLVGTKLMQCAPTIAIDLPQKVLVWEDADGSTQITYNNPEFLQAQHDMQGCEEIITKVSGLLAGLTSAAAE